MSERKSGDVPVTWDEYMAIIGLAILILLGVLGVIEGAGRLAARIKTSTETESENINVETTETTETIETASSSAASD